MKDIWWLAHLYNTLTSLEWAISNSNHDSVFLKGPLELNLQTKVIYQKQYWEKHHRRIWQTCFSTPTLLVTLSKIVHLRLLDDLKATARLAHSRVSYKCCTNPFRTVQGALLERAAVFCKVTICCNHSVVNSKQSCVHLAGSSFGHVTEASLTSANTHSRQAERCRFDLARQVCCTILQFRGGV